MSDEDFINLLDLSEQSIPESFQPSPSERAHFKRFSVHFLDEHSEKLRRPHHLATKIADICIIFLGLGSANFLKFFPRLGKVGSDAERPLQVVGGFRLLSKPGQDRTHKVMRPRCVG